MSRRNVVRELRASRDERKRMNAKLGRIAQQVRKGQPTQSQYDEIMRMRHSIAEMRIRLDTADTKAWIPEGQRYNAEKDIAAVERKIDILAARGVAREEQRARSA
tara:strand:+ start:143 stop:457 length:315 start_codon:yes stop_codon:yes gene_type:complete